MTLTFIDLYNECAGQPWSMFDAEAESQDDFETALKISINKAISYLWNFQPWKFKIQTMILKTRVGKESYGVPDGNIIKKTINGKQYFDGSGLRLKRTQEAFLFVQLFFKLFEARCQMNALPVMDVLVGVLQIHRLQCFRLTNFIDHYLKKVKRIW